jgi:hypothetical protein
MTANSTGYSSQVEIALILGGQSIALAQLGPAHCILREPFDFPPADGEIVLQVDGNVTRLQVRLDQGGSIENARVPYTRLAPPTRMESASQPAAYTH